MQPVDRYFLPISYQESECLGCLLFNDPALLKEIEKLLQGYRNHPIAEIGSMDLSHLL
jgi:hypothetical protein